jgi:hypothetical protein
MRIHQTCTKVHFIILGVRCFFFSVLSRKPERRLESNLGYYGQPEQQESSAVSRTPAALEYEKFI